MYTYIIDMKSCPIACVNLQESDQLAHPVLLIEDRRIWPRGFKTIFMLNSAEHKVLNAHKYENIKKFSIFQAQVSLEYYFSCL